MQINILGSPWNIYYRSPKDDKTLKDGGFDGYCDKTTRTIVVTSENGNLGDFKIYQKAVLRHEIIHAFMYESGLGSSWQHAEQFGHDETAIDWIAMQFPKLLQAFKEAKAL